MRRFVLSFPWSVAVLLTLVFVSQAVWAQTASTGALVGTVHDPSGAIIVGASVSAVNSAMNISRATATNESGTYTLSLLPPGTYAVTVSTPGFSTQTQSGIVINATETATLNIKMELGTSSEQITVESSAALVQSENATLGRVINENSIRELPLTNRNYTQILMLSPGVAAGVNNAASLGRNTQEMNVNGGRVMDNSFQMDGADLSNNQTARGGDVVSAAGIAIPNPDAIQEFKVQTSLYDAGYGRGAGANVNVVTKSGTNAFHGSVFEFVRNEKLNANDFFLNRNSQPRAIYKQNQFGGTFGGPIHKDKLFFFGSYQGTRQVNGIGSNSLQSAFLPPLTNDRSAATLGRQFCGQKGSFGGVGVACDGSNINQVALKLLNYKLPNSDYIIPTPQVIQSNGLGFSVFSIPSRFTENQELANADWVLSKKQTLAGRFFYSRDPEIQSFTGSNTPGSGLTALFINKNAVARHTYVISPRLMNEASFGYHKIYGEIMTLTPVKNTDIGLQGSYQEIIPTMSVTGLFSLAGTLNDGQHIVSETFAPSEQILWSHGKHNTRAGVGFERVRAPFADPAITRGSLVWQSFPDFLLSMSATQNGSAYSNIFSSTGRNGITDRDLRVNSYSAFFQDDFKVASRLTLNLGLRWEGFGQAADTNGHLVNFWPHIADNNFGSNGTFSGLVAASNFDGTLPTGVLRNQNKASTVDSLTLRNFGPRVGFAWQPFASWTHMVVRAGYGLYYTRTPVNDVFQLIVDQPFLISQINQGVLNAAATFQNPFNPGPPPPSSLPMWIPRTAQTRLTISTVAPFWTPPRTHQWGLNLQFDILRNYLLEIGYLGSRGERIEKTRNINQAFLAGPTNPINGITTNTITNAADRVPYVGYAPTGLSQREDYGYSLYNSLQTSVMRRFSRGLQFQASYTFSKALTDVAGQGAFGLGGGSYYDVRNRRAAWGPADFDRRQRFVLHYLWELPNVHQGHGALGIVMGGWQFSGVATLQSGSPLTVSDTRAGSIVGLSSQAGQLCTGSTALNIPTAGTVDSRLDNYFNKAAFCAPPTVGNGYGFGTLSRGIVRGPDQRNFDMALTKKTIVNGLRENSYLQFRAEFFNAFNTPQFANPGTNVSASNFGKISATAVTPRMIQLAIKFVF